MTWRNFIQGPTTMVAVWLSLQTMAAAERQEPLPPQTVQPVILAITYPQDDTVSVVLGGTSRLPRASGEAKVERKSGATEIELELDEMKPAHLFGGDYNTYVLWAISPQGQADNLGEFILDGNRSKLNVTTTLETFGLVVTAEPHFLVSSPSSFLVLQNERVKRGPAAESTATLRHPEIASQYEFEHASLESMPETDARIHPHLEEAKTAVELAERAGASREAPEAMARAREALARAEGMESAEEDPEEVLPLAHEAVRHAVTAREMAAERASRAAVARVMVEQESAIREKERRIEELASQAAAARSDAERARLQAEGERLRAELEADRAQSAERQARQALEERRETESALASKETELEHMEQRLRELEAQAGAAATDAERARIVAEQERLRAVLGAERAAEAEDRAHREMTARMEAEQEAAQARLEKEEARRQLQLALGEILEVRETARGLIVNVPNVLFDLDRASLKPEGREKLSQVAGILALAQGFRLSIEGHADNTGEPAYNLDLSRRRSESVRDYLVSLGVPPNVVSMEAWGEERPIASNATTEGRQQNRRVEIVVEELPDFAIVVLRPTEER